MQTLGMEIRTSSIVWSPDSTALAIALYDFNGAGWYKNVRTLIVPSQNNTPVFTLQRVSAAITSMTWTADGSRLLTVSIGGEIVLWNALTGELLNIYQSEDSFLGAAIRPDGMVFATVGYHNNVVVRDLLTGEVIYNFDLGRPSEDMLGCEGALSWVDWNPIGSQIAVTGWDGYLKSWDLNTTSLIHNIPAHSGMISNAEWSPDGSKLVTGSEDMSVRIWIMVTGQMIMSLQGHTNYINEVTWSPDGSQVASASADGTVRIWDTSTGQLVRLIETGLEAVRAIDWSSDGRLAYGGTGSNSTFLPTILSIASVS
jgi:WD40 repeat protein